MDAGDGRQRVQAQLQVEGAAAQVVQDAHVIAAGAEVQRGGPAAVAVAAWNQGIAWFNYLRVSCRCRGVFCSAAMSLAACQAVRARGCFSSQCHCMRQCNVDAVYVSNMPKSAGGLQC